MRGAGSFCVDELVKQLEKAATELQKLNIQDHENPTINLCKLQNGLKSFLKIMKGSKNQPHKMKKGFNISNQSQTKEKNICDTIKEQTALNMPTSWKPTKGKNSGKHGPREPFVSENADINEINGLAKSPAKNRKEKKPKILQQKEKEDMPEEPSKSRNAKKKRIIKKPKWKPVRAMWDAGKSKFMSLMLWNINSGSEAHCFIAEERRKITSHGKGAGVSMMVRKTVGITSTSEANDPSGMWTVLEIVPRLKSEHKRIYGVYISPSATDEQYKALLEHLSIRIDVHKKHMPLILGDFNTGEHTPRRKKALQTFLDKNKMSIWNSEDTHTRRNATPRRLDLVIGGNYLACQTLNAETEHKPVKLCILNVEKKKQPQLPKRRDSRNSKIGADQLSDIIHEVTSGTYLPDAIRKIVEQAVKKEMQIGSKPDEIMENIRLRVTENPDPSDQAL
eukprot:GHVP01044543.1.p1 GENE.GHVP01044543.1~~GHVP01044543.1.p1  ORF type:complete len:449 (+),score=77.14 GHVP01044543.1:205-1551(+)